MDEITLPNGAELCLFTNRAKAEAFAKEHVLLNVRVYEVEVYAIAYWFYKLIGH